jgi:predicted RNA-binding protein with PIN domain
MHFLANELVNALLLNGMGSENPFTNTKSIAFINDTPATAVGARNSMSKGEELIQNKSRFVTMIVSGAVLVFVIVALVWAVQRRRRLIKEAQRTQLEYVEKQDIKATGYLESIRRQYRDEEPSNTEVFSGDESEDEVMTQATDNRQTLSELREAMSALESLVSQDVESSEARYPKPPSDVDEDENQKKNAEYMNYLDLQASFDEEDLRS